MGEYAGNQGIGIYIHIPFCIAKCSYCDFLSGPMDDFVKAAYVDQLARELEAVCGQISRKGAYIRTVYFGGGTPSILSGEQIEQLMKVLRDSGLFMLKSGVHKQDCKPEENNRYCEPKETDHNCIPHDTNHERNPLSMLPRNYTEITLEMNPGTAELSKLQQFKASGINRLSMGMQSFQPGELKTLGRIHSVEQGIAAYKMAREAGFKNISVDLMSGLPGQTIESYRDSLEQLIALNPEHISSYSLILEEGTPFYIRYEDYWTEEQEELDREMYELTGTLLKEAGYERYEISNYSKPGYESRHNSSYWKGIPYYGCGLGASSLILEGDCWYRTVNQSKLENYLKIDGFDTDNLMTVPLYEEVEPLSKQAMMEEFMFLGLRMTKGIRPSEFQSRFGCLVESVFGDALKKLEREELLIMQEDQIRLTERGLDLSNYCFEQFIL